MNARALGYTTAVDEEIIKPVREHFTAIAKRENLPIGRPLEYDALHPLPPGAGRYDFELSLSTCQPRQTRQAARSSRRSFTGAREFGYPIMVTPYPQFFGVASRH